MHQEKRRAADTVSFCLATGGRSHLQHQELGRNEPRGWIWPLGSLKLQFLLAFAPAQQARPWEEQGPSQGSEGAGTHSLSDCSLWQGTPSAVSPRPSRVRPSRPRERALAAGSPAGLTFPGGRRWRRQTGSPAIGFPARAAHWIHARDVVTLTEPQKPRLGQIGTLRPHFPTAESPSIMHEGPACRLPREVRVRH